ncbi:MAG: hypothetical protein HY509_02570, partial [Acidobacteria bacterium]|nr:hypothetical protein [Acidobacteriota bacterium]
MKPDAVPDRPQPPGSGWPAVVAALPFLLLRSVSPNESYDFWWHLKTGEWILRTGSLPTADPYSFTAAGIPWVDHSWLFQVALHLAHRAAGFWGPAGLRLGLLAVAVVAAARYLSRRGVGPATTAAVVLACLWGSCFRLTVRPDLASWTGTALLLLLLGEVRRTGRPWPAALAAALLPVWANLHIGAVLAPALILPFCIEPWFFRGERQGGGTHPGAGRGRSAAPMFWCLFGWSWVALGINPWGWRAYLVVLHLADLTARPWGRNLEWAAPEVIDFPLLYAALAVTACLPLVRRRIPDPPVYLAVALMGIMGSISLRFVGLYFAGLPFLLAGYLARPEGSSGSAPRARWRSAAAWGTAACLGAGLPIHAASAHPFRADFLLPDRFPAGAVDFLERNRIPAERMFNDVKFGGYLIWRRYPGARVFIDGRNEVYAALLPEVFAALRSAEAWRALLDRYRIDAALLRYPPALSPVIYPAAGEAPSRRDSRPFSVLYFPRAEWALVHWDDAAMLFLRRTPANADPIRRHEYRILRPDDDRNLFRRAGRDPELRRALRGEIERKIAEDPDCRR